LKARWISVPDHFQFFNFPKSLIAFKINIAMKKITFLFAALILFSSHDMFLKMGTYFLRPNSPAAIKVFNGTFDKSENVIARKRMADVSLLGNGVRTNPDTMQWSEIDSTLTVLNFTTGEAGTWVAGLSSFPNQIELAAKDFNEYLEHDGVLDMLELRRKNNALDKDAVEKYSKHVKAIFQVGNKKTDDWKTPLGYPIEFVPEENPYDLETGKTMKVKLLWQGQPLANQLVYAGSDGSCHEQEHSRQHAAGEEHSHDHEDSHTHGASQLRTDANGVVSLKIDHEGQWYLRTIHMAQSSEQGLTHESNWATLTFEIGHGHSHADGSTHTHEDGTVHSDHGFPVWAYGLLGAALLAVLLFFFRRKK
jgi:hypothetical protein